MPRPGLRPSLAAALLTSAALVCACGPAERTVVVHEPEGDAARALWTVDFVHEFTIPDNFRYQTEEYGSAAADPARGLVYVGSRDGTLLAVDDDSGAFAWELDVGGGLSSVPVPIRVDLELGLGHVAGPEERPDWLLLGTDDGALTAVDLDTRAVVWRYRTSGVVRTPAVVGEGVVYFANSRDEIFAVTVREGEWVWQYSGEFQKDFTVYGRAGLAYLSPAEAEAAGLDTFAATGGLFTGLSDGKVVALDAAGGTPKWIETLAPLGSDGTFVDVDTTPLIDARRGELLVANQAAGVFALAIADGGRRWNTPVRAVGSLVEGPGGLIIAASSLEGLFGLERDGRIRWHQQLDPGSLATPLVVGSVVLVAHSDAGLLGYASADGELLARFLTGSGSSGQPTFDPVLGRVYASSDRGQLYALRVLP